MKSFVHSEHTRNVELHLQSVKSILKLFAATRHNHYAKSARLYLQNMLNLESNFPWVSLPMKVFTLLDKVQGFEQVSGQI